MPAGLTRQALYHHFKSKGSAVPGLIDRLYESAPSPAAINRGGTRRGEAVWIVVADTW